MAPVSEQAFERLADRVTDIERNFAVREETLKSIELRLSKIEGTLSRLTWIILSAIGAGVMGWLIQGGLNVPIPVV